MAYFSARVPGRDGRLRQVAAWMGAAAVYGAAQGLSAWVARYAQGRGTRPQYEQFERPAFAPPGAVFPVVWTALNLTTATSAWLVWRAGGAGPEAPSRRVVLAWWALAVIARSGYVPLASGSRRLWAATADSALLCAVMAHYASLARRVDRAAAALAVPEIAWTAFATVLSAAVAMKNSGPAVSRPAGPGHAGHASRCQTDHRRADLIDLASRPLRRRYRCGPLGGDPAEAGPLRRSRVAVSVAARAVTS